MMSAVDDASELERLADVLRPICHTSRVQWDREWEWRFPLLFAVGVKMVHSIDLRRVDGDLVVEFWKGFPDDDFISKSKFETFDDALLACKTWLMKDSEEA
ncbi:hypothetical protein GCM10025793_20790 [Lysobacter lycopersici]